MPRLRRIRIEAIKGMNYSIEAMNTEDGSKKDFTYISESCRWNPHKGWYEIMSGDMWIKVPSMRRESLCALLNDLSIHPERRNPFDRGDRP